MNIYDFDDTIFNGNSLRRFYVFCAVRLPYLWLLLPEFLLALILRCLRLIGKDAFLHMLEVFVVFVPHRPKFVQKFWDKNIGRVKEWYLQRKCESDLVISASPAYIIVEACARLGIRCMASDNGKNGVVLGKHCYGAEKVVRFRNVFPNEKVATFYSDSWSDLPMLKSAEEGYFVEGDKVTLVCRNGELLQEK